MLPGGQIRTKTRPITADFPIEDDLTGQTVDVADPNGHVVPE